MGYAEVNKQAITDMIRMAELTSGAPVALGEAARWSNCDEIKRLLAQGCGADDRIPPNNVTSLMLASKARVASILVESGADVNARDSQGNTPLIWFLKMDFGKKNAHSYIKRLIELGADIEAVASDGASAIELAQAKYNMDLRSLGKELN